LRRQGTPSQLTLRRVGREIYVYQVTEAEIDELAGAGLSFSIWASLTAGVIGSLIALIASWLSNPPDSDRVIAVFTGVVIALIGLAIGGVAISIKEGFKASKKRRALINFNDD